jgi:hypothetical protein|tara:strand:- start:416 stop:655 length:240 start_codon:yes stop_codon:yes gene_type:complete
MNELENKINRWYPCKDEDGRVGNMVWLAKHWYRWITYGCPQCYVENCGCSPNNSNIHEPKGFAEIAKYAYDNYGDMYKK